jgi:hypothetical protein
MSGAIDLRFIRDDGLVEIRKISIGARPPASDTPVPIAEVLRFSLIGAQGVLAQLFVPQDPAAIGSVLRERMVTDVDIDAARAKVRAAVDQAEDRVASSEANGTTIDGVELTKVGWWCNQCAYLRNCPAIPQQSVNTLIGAYPQ